MDNLTDKILGIASDFGCDVEGFRPHLEQIVRELETKNPPSRNKVGDASNSIAEAQIKELQVFRRRDFKFDETYDYVINRIQELNEEIQLSCAIGDTDINGVSYDEIVEIAHSYIKELGGFEKFAEWGLV